MMQMFARESRESARMKEDGRERPELDSPGDPARRLERKV